MSGREPGQHADMWLVFGSTGNCYLRDHLCPGTDADIWYRKLASKPPVSTRRGGLGSTYVEPEGYTECALSSEEMKPSLGRKSSVAHIFQGFRGEHSLVLIRERFLSSLCQ